jgi:AraC-like DNA-binding protein
MQRPDVERFRQDERIDEHLGAFLSKKILRGDELSEELQSVLDCIHGHVFEPDLNVKTLKARCQIRDNNVSSRFRYTLGIGIKEYIESLRMEAAMLLLREEGLPVFHVAKAVGYAYEETFYRAFRRHFGCTPARHRRRHSPWKRRHVRDYDELSSSASDLLPMMAAVVH